MEHENCQALAPLVHTLPAYLKFQCERVRMPNYQGVWGPAAPKGEKTQRERKLSQWSTDWVEQLHLPQERWAPGLLLYSLCSSILLLLHCPPGREQTLYVERLPFAVYMFPVNSSPLELRCQCYEATMMENIFWLEIFLNILCIDSATKASDPWKHSN